MKKVYALVAALVIVLSLSLSGCTSFAMSKAGNCAPSHNVSLVYVGTLHVQQWYYGGSAVQWGLAPWGSWRYNTHFVVTVYAGTQRIDYKDQFYTPHGSVSGYTAWAHRGQILKIIGWARNGTKTLIFDNECRLSP